jgi:hypothetical protein
MDLVRQLIDPLVEVPPDLAFRASSITASLGFFIPSARRVLRGAAPSAFARMIFTCVLCGLFGHARPGLSGLFADMLVVLATQAGRGDICGGDKSCALGTTSDGSTERADERKLK